MFCEKCGSKNDAESVFCFNCGNKLNTDQTESTVEQVETSNSSQRINASEFNATNNSSRTKQLCLACKGKGSKTTLKFLFSVFMTIFVIPVVGLFSGAGLAIPVAMIAMIMWGVKGRKCKVCGGTGRIIM